MPIPHQAFISPGLRHYLSIGLSTILLILASSPVLADRYPRKEFSFCPAGGPTGWMNHFDSKSRQKRAENYWRHRRAMSRAYNYPAAYPAAYRMPDGSNYSHPYYYPHIR